MTVHPQQLTISLRIRVAIVVPVFSRRPNYRAMPDHRFNSVISRNGQRADVKRGFAGIGLTQKSDCLENCMLRFDSLQYIVGIR